jgi:hypothetical protein
MLSFKKCRSDNIDKLGKCKLLKIEPCNFDCISCNKRREDSYYYDIHRGDITLLSGNYFLTSGTSVIISSGTRISCGTVTNNIVWNYPVSENTAYATQSEQVYNNILA